MNIQEALAEIKRRQLEERAGDALKKMTPEQIADLKKSNPGAAEKIDQKVKEVKPTTTPAPPNTGGAKPATTTPSSTAVTTSGAAPAPAGSARRALGRALPVAGAALGAMDAYDRVKKGDYTGAAISAGGGLASFVPKIGTAAALGAVGINMARDAAKSSNDTENAPAASSGGSTPASSAGGSTPAASPAPKADAAKTTPTTTQPNTGSSKMANPTDKAVKTVKTKGGDYNVYKKGSETAASFRDTYKKASESGAGTFKWKDAQGNERSYTTGKKGGEYKGDAPAAAATATTGNSQTSDGDRKVTVDKDVPAAPVAPASSGQAGIDRADQIAKKQGAIAGGATPAAAAKEFGGAVTPSAAQIQPNAVDRARGAENNAKTGRTDGTDPTAVGTFADPDVQAAERAKNLAAQKKPETPAATPAPAAEPAGAAPQTAAGRKRATTQSINNSYSPMIAAFLKLQETKTGNMFEAAKKLKGDQHKLDKNKNGKLDGDDFEKLRAEEVGTGMVKKDGKDYVPDSVGKNPNMQVSKDGPSKADKKALDNKFKEVAKEEFEELFSDEELDHINLVIEGRGRPKGAKNKPKEGTAAAVGAGTETNGRDPRQHIQVIAGQAAGGRQIEFNHNDGSKTTIGPAMGRKIIDHLGDMKPADRQAAVNKMHNSADNLKGM